VYETLDMSQLPEYTIGGTLHIVVNNQVRPDPLFGYQFRVIVVSMLSCFGHADQYMGILESFHLV